MAAPERKNTLAGAISPACVHFYTLILPFCRLDTSCLWVYGLVGDGAAAQVACFG